MQLRVEHILDNLLVVGVCVPQVHVVHPPPGAPVRCRVVGHDAQHVHGVHTVGAGTHRPVEELCHDVSIIQCF